MVAGNTPQARQAALWNAATIARPWLSLHQIEEALFASVHLRLPEFEQSVRAFQQAEDPQQRISLLQACAEVVAPAGTLEEDGRAFALRLSRAIGLSDDEAAESIAAVLHELSERQPDAATLETPDDAGDPAAAHHYGPLPEDLDELFGANRNADGSWSLGDQPEPNAAASSEREAKATRLNFPYTALPALRVLGLDQRASSTDVRASWLRVAMAHHPDRLVHLSDAERVDAERRFKAAAEAYDQLTRRRVAMGE